MTTVRELGFEDLSVSRVATRMGIPRTTLYGHFASNDLLVAAAIDDHWRSIEWPSSEHYRNWRDYLESIVWALWDHTVSRPGVAAAMESLHRNASPLIPVNPEMVTALLDYGFPPHNAVLALDVLSDLTSQAFFKDRAADAPVTAQAPGSARWGQMKKYVDTLPAVVREQYLGMIGGSAKAWFAVKLDLVLDGIAVGLPEIVTESDQ